MTADQSRIIYTIGHSTHALDVFIAMLEAHQVKAVADVRRFPASRRHPHFNRETLEAALQSPGIEYHWFEALGGRRKPLPIEDSSNTGWRNDAFRGYADYMQTEGFQSALADLESLGRRVSTAIMCAEAVEWRCHRRLIADALFARGWRIPHIHSADPGRTTIHALPQFAQRAGTAVRYPGGTLFEGGRPAG